MLHCFVEQQKGHWIRSQVTWVLALTLLIPLSADHVASCWWGVRRKWCWSLIKPILGSCYWKWGLASPHWKSYLRGKVDRKESFLYFLHWQFGGESGLMSRGQLPTDSQWARTYKGEFQGCVGYRQEGAICRNSTVSSDSRLEIGCAVVRSESSWLCWV